MRPAALLLASLLLAGCLQGGAGTTTTTSPAPGGNGAPPPDGESLAVRDLARGSFSGIRDETRVLLRDAGSWEALWARHGGDGAPPEVSFPNESVVAVVVQGPTGCFGVHVGNVTYDAGARVVTIEVVHETTPENVRCTQALVDAYDFVAIPSREGEVRFVDVDREADAGSTGKDRSFRTLDAGIASGIHDERARGIADQATWEAFWAEHASNMMPAPPLPPVDFTRERVFVATAGDRSNTCWALRVERVFEDEGKLTIGYTLYSPPPATMCGQAVTQPFHFIAFEGTEGTAAVEKTERTGTPPDG